MKSLKGVSVILGILMLTLPPVLTVHPGLGPTLAQADDADDKVNWHDIIGLVRPQPVAAGQLLSTVGSGTGTVEPGLRPWSTTSGEAQVKLDKGEIRFKVLGLVLTDGNSVGTPDGITAVRATLVCDTDGSAGGGHSALVDTPPVPLSAQGDAEFHGRVGPLPMQCDEPDIAFLIRTAEPVPPPTRSGLWIAAGAVRKP